jgi:hypothetical protein
MRRFVRYAVMVHALLIGTAAAQDPAPAGSGCAQTEPISGEAFFDPSSETARFETLRASASPRLRALAANLSFMLDDPRAVPESEIEQVVARAASDAPDDAFVQWQAVRTPWQQAHCDPLCAPDLALARVLQVEPENAVAWLIPLGRARMHDDASAIDDALAHMAAATRADDHFIDALGAWTQAYAESPETGATLPLSPTFGAGSPPRVHALADALQRLSYSSDRWEYYRLNESCEADAASPGTWQRLGWCAVIARQLATHGTSFTMRQAGFMLLDQLESPGANHEAQKRESWLAMHSPSPFYDPLVVRESPDDVLADWDHVPNEIAASERRLRRHNLPLDPPAGWFGGPDVAFGDMPDDSETATAPTTSEAKFDTPP